MERIYIITFLTYYLIATFLLCNILFNSRIKFTLINKKTKEEKEPTNTFIILYCLFWIIFIPLSKYEGEK